MRELHPDWYWGPGSVSLLNTADESMSSWAADLATLLPDDRSVRDTKHVL